MNAEDRDLADEGQARSALAALALATQKLGLSLSVEQLCRDYGDEECFSLPQLAEIIGDHGVKAKPIRMNWKLLSQMEGAVAAVIQLNDGSLLVFENFVDDPQTPRMVFRDPADSKAARFVVDELRLMENWSGHVLLMKREMTEASAREEFGFHWLLAQVMQDRRMVRDVFISAISLGILALVPSLFYMVVIDKVMVHHRLSTLTLMAAAILVVLLFDMLLGYMRRTVTAIVTAKIDVRLNLMIFDRLSRLPIEFFEQNATGGIVHRLGEARRLRAFVTGQLFGSVLDMLSLFVLIPVMFLLSPGLTFWVLGLGAMMSLILFIYMKPIRRAYAQVMGSEHRRTAMLIEMINGIRTVKSLALEGRKRREWDQKVAEAVNNQTNLLFLANQPQTLLAPLEKLIYAGSLLIGAYLVIVNEHTVMTGTLVAFTMIAMRATQPLVQMAGMMQQMEEARGALRQVASVINAEPEPRREHGVRPEFSGRISFEDVRFAYAGTAVPALNAINFHVKPGNIVGLMGRSGSGKTTVTRLLQGLHQSYSGLIRLDGVELKEVDLYHLRTNVGVVLQESFLFRGTIRDNILIAKPDASPEEMIEAAQLAGADEFIERLPRGYDTMLEEHASNLSGGQKQRLAIARALIVNPPILIFDEATSALDPESEAIILRNLKRIAEGRTVLMISHRLSSLVDCDQILVLDRGQLKDSGTHHDLLRRSGDYRHLWNQQNRHLTTGKDHDENLDAVA
ncbi:MULTISPECIES: peptidase domain-containing ABC transporter [Rhizobium/Agrobacterium group]|uniref:ABC transporter nucleotide binding/ATPase protein n=2 Tax=Rhizobium/Agrobacterium group TaxID=227290 RepID=B9JST9_ALLAM|nr:MULTISPECIES: peptidase domain-containing ABC transporter [Rhizobium/Agrobacterium group]ACM37782.1 ABC transporter nucleotide binding/ATPase protein [Allorhizobium ampelinum S4]MUO29246.1 ATP-binding cassette domain-containing protein [Agrobacterium vitis]MUO43698.1 ATP-binding cassette domain-containing protein [Agrobacterium vitis]MUP12487.1 ATP-binding cassette domain-containing protein [Agrobacterium vitis]